MLVSLSLLLISLSIAHARPSSASGGGGGGLQQRTGHAAIPHEASDELKAGLILRTLAAIERETRLGRTVDFDAVLSREDKRVLGLVDAEDDAELGRRQLLGGGSEYAPYEMPCPSGYEWVRSANGLSNGEQSYIEARRPKVGPAINRQLASHGLPAPPRTPVIGLALSGGGYRAMTVGSGGVMGLNNRSSEAAASGTGGWLDGVMYQAGLSGGSWATGTTFVNNASLPTDLVRNTWNLASNLVAPSDGKVSFYYNMLSNVRAKSNAGFQTQIADYWSLALGDHLLPSQYHLSGTPNYTFSSTVSSVPGLMAGDVPMPIIIAAEREPGEVVVPANASVYEMTPWEFGSWAFGSTTKVRGAFTPLEYLGSSLNNGQANGTCYKGFDQMSFVLGTSSTLFSGALVTLTSANASSVIVDAIQSLLSSISDQENDIAAYPNPFRGWNTASNPVSGFNTLTLVDAGLTNQNIPIEPLLIPARNVDAIIAFDSSADTTYSWPNGSALRTTYERAQVLARTQDVAINMPRVPSVNGFINGGLNQRPVFFGCNDTTIGGNGSVYTPIIVYVPNYPWSAAGNVSTYQLSYEEAEALAVVNNGQRSLTLNGTVASWPRCLSCALADRAYGGPANRSAECQSCFNTWCWNGEDDDSAPSGDYAPVVGRLPSFIADGNLGQAAPAPTGTGGASASANGNGNGAAPAGSSAPATSPASAAGRGVQMPGMAGWVGAVGMGMGAVLGGVAVLL